MNTNWKRKPVFEAPEQPPLSSLKGWADHHDHWDYWLAIPALGYLQAEGCTLITDKNLESQALELHGIRTPDGVIFTRWCVDLLWLVGLLSGVLPPGRQYLALLSPMRSKLTRDRPLEAALRDFLADSMQDWRRGLQGMGMYQLLRALELVRSDAPWQSCPVDPEKVLEPHLRRLSRDSLMNDVLEIRI